MLNKLFRNQTITNNKTITLLLLKNLKIVLKKYKYKKVNYLNYLSNNLK